jgi:formate dehydrogenase
MRMGLAQVYEVASFYHHFRILEDGQPAPRLTLRVCNGLSCTLAGADDLFQQLQVQMDPGVQVLRAPCVGRCDTAPVAVVHQRAVGHANLGLVQACVAAGSPPESPHSAHAWPQAPLANTLTRMKSTWLCCYMLRTSLQSQRDTGGQACHPWSQAPKYTY